MSELNTSPCFTGVWGVSVETPTFGVRSGVSSSFSLAGYAVAERSSGDKTSWGWFPSAAASYCRGDGRPSLHQEGFHVATECLELTGVWFKGLLFVRLGKALIKASQPRSLLLLLLQRSFFTSY